MQDLHHIVHAVDFLIDQLFFVAFNNLGKDGIVRIYILSDSGIVFRMGDNQSVFIGDDNIAARSYRFVSHNILEIRKIDGS